VAAARVGVRVDRRLIEPPAMLLVEVEVADRDAVVERERREPDDAVG
jgi:hypothetical protein